MKSWVWLAATLASVAGIACSGGKSGGEGGGGGGGGGASYSVGGSIVGLAGTIVLQNNGGDDLTLSADGSFRFATAVAEGRPYAVTVKTQPAGQECTVQGGAGTVSSSDVTTVAISCGERPAGYLVKGTVSGLSGTLVLQNNGSDDLTITQDGGFQFATRLDDGARYSVTVKSQPQAQDCSVSHGSGSIAGSDATDVAVRCESRAYRLTNRGISSEAPSVVKAAIHVTRVADGSPVIGLDPEDFEVLEDDTRVTRSESFLDAVEFGAIPYTLKTVISLDVSSSLTQADIAKVKETAVNLVADPVTGESRLLPGQEVAIYTFDDRVTLRIDFTSNVAALLGAIDGITRGGPSTNLYGAIQTGLSRWEAAYTLDHITSGAMVVVSDGNDTAGIVTQEQAAAARGDKQLFVIPVGAEIDRSKLEAIAGADHVYPASDYSELQAIMAQVTEQMSRFSDGLYLVYYATPKRSGTHTITISLEQNENDGPDSKVTGTFLADGFSNVVPEVVKVGPDVVREGTPVRWDVRSRWTNDAPSYTVAVDDPNHWIEVERLGSSGEGRGEAFLLSATGNGFGSRNATITDSVNALTLPTSITVKTSTVPAQLTATAGHQVVDLAWRAVSDATSYNLYVTANGIDSVIPVTGTSYRHEGLINGREYTYRVTSLIEGVESAPGAPVTATPRIPGPTLNPIEIYDGTATLTWQDVVSNYRVHWSNTPGVTHASPFLESTERRTTHEGLVAGRRYYYAVASIDTNGSESQLSQERAAPAIPEATVTAGANRIDVSWLDADGATGYEIYSSTGPDPRVGGSRTTNATSPASVGGANGTTYAVTLLAQNADGKAYSFKASVTPCGSGDWEMCGTECVNLATTANCGSCGNACTNPGEICASDACACPQGDLLCDTGCADPQLSPANCGACGNLCDVACSAGQCASIAATSGHYSHQCALLTDGTVRCWGRNDSAQLGTGGGDSLVPGVVMQFIGGPLTGVAEIVTGGTQTCARRTDGTVRCWGSIYGGLSGSPAGVTGLTTVAQLAAGMGHVCAVLPDQTLRCWGDNTNGQLGDGTSTSRTNPVAVTGLSNVREVTAGTGHTCARLGDNTVRCWGDGRDGQLGSDSILGAVNGSPVQVSRLNGVASIAAGSHHTCARMTDSTVRCWGWNIAGQLGNGTTTSAYAPVSIAGLTNVEQVAAGDRHSCARLADGTVKCWGDNSAGQLGDGTTSSSTTPVLVSGVSDAAEVTTGRRHTCVRHLDGSLTCWGLNDFGQLGNATTTASLSPVLPHW